MNNEDENNLLLKFLPKGVSSASLFYCCTLQENGFELSPDRAVERAPCCQF